MSIIWVIGGYSSDLELRHIAMVKRVANTTPSGLPAGGLPSDGQGTPARTGVGRSRPMDVPLGAPSGNPHRRAGENRLRADLPRSNHGAQGPEYLDGRESRPALPPRRTSSSSSNSSPQTQKPPLPPRPVVNPAFSSPQRQPVAQPSHAEIFSNIDVFKKTLTQKFSKAVLDVKHSVERDPGIAAHEKSRHLSEKMTGLVQDLLAEAKIPHLALTEAPGHVATELLRLCKPHIEGRFLNARVNGLVLAEVGKIADPTARANALGKVNAALGLNPRLMSPFLQGGSRPQPKPPTPETFANTALFKQTFTGEISGAIESIQRELARNPNPAGPGPQRQLGEKMCEMIEGVLVEANIGQLKNKEAPGVVASELLRLSAPHIHDKDLASQAADLLLGEVNRISDPDTRQHALGELGKTMGLSLAVMKELNEIPDASTRQIVLQELKRVVEPAQPVPARAPTQAEIFSNTALFKKTFIGAIEQDFDEIKASVSHDATLSSHEKQNVFAQKMHDMVAGALADAQIHKLENKEAPGVVAAELLKLCVSHISNNDLASKAVDMLLTASSRIPDARTREHTLGELGKAMGQNLAVMKELADIDDASTRQLILTELRSMNNRY